MRFDVITLFPELVNAVTSCGVVGKAVEAGTVSLQCWNPRDYTQDKHRTVDDRPYGGGPGMVMKVEPLVGAINAAKAQNPQAKTVYLSPQGKPLKQATLQEAIAAPGWILIAGRYEGVDQRVINQHVDEEWSIGDYVLSGGELAAMVVIDGMSRLIPGVLGHDDSAQQDSFSAEGLLDCPHYTRPEDYNGDKVPSVLLDGNHKAIEDWRRQQMLGQTWQRRPDIIQRLQAEQALSEEDEAFLKEYIAQLA